MSILKMACDSKFTCSEPDATIAAIREQGLPYITVSNIVGCVKAVIVDTDKTASSTSTVKAAITILTEIVNMGKCVEYLTIPLLAPLLGRLALEKDAEINAMIITVTDAIISSVSDAAIPVVLDVLYDCIVSTTYKWKTRVAALNLIGGLAVSHSTSVHSQLPFATPRISACMGDTRPEVTNAAYKALSSVFMTVGNKDISHVIPTIVSSIACPNEVSEAIHALSSTTFVQAVDEATLAVLTPLLHRGINERIIAVKRKAAVVITNMVKLVPNPRFAAPLIPKLLPSLKRLRDEVSDPDCRAIATKAFNTLLEAAGCATEEEAMKKAETMDVMKNSNKITTKVVQKAVKPVKLPIIKEVEEEVVVEDTPIMTALNNVIALSNMDLIADSNNATIIACKRHITDLATRLVDAKNWSVASWAAAVCPYIAPMLSAKHDEHTLSLKFLNRMYFTINGCNLKAMDSTESVMDPDAEDASIPDLCNCEFSLAYGGLILLNMAQLHMKRGRRYGLLGRNGCGKSTLMKAIANGQIEGFPTKKELRTAYVEAAIDVPEGVTVIEFVLSDPLVAEINSDVSVANAQLYALGFTPAMLAGPIAGLSGGWRMKCALARAILAKVDLFLLDEPTNHLDVANVAWITNFLSSADFDVSCLIVSHDATFLDNVCTHIIHYDGNFKLKSYKGNLTAFVERCPEAKSYFDLAATTVTFTFPEPGFLDGVKSKDKAILKANTASVTYPGCSAPSLIDATIALSLSSRVVVHGRNGAGKSTLIKVITGEIEPTTGSIWKHPGVRIAYVAQHAFHHLEEHLDKTPCEYLTWRYATGEDRECQAKVSNIISDEEQARMNEKVIVDGQKLVIETLLARRKLGREWEYEVKFVGLPADKNQYMPRRWLESIGWGKAVDALDSREAAASGLMSKPLTSMNIVKHFEQVGLESEFSLHNRMRGFSGGQKVKIVLGAALWQNPHILVLDEPSNYIDVDSLGALSAALKTFGGGVILVTHHAAFTRDLASETWDVVDGLVTTTGMKWAATALERGLEADEIIDAAGNVIKITPKLSAKDQRRKQKERAARRKRGEEVFSDEDI